MLFTYPAILHKEADGYWAEFLDLEGCVTQGDTLAEVIYNCQDALNGYIYTCLKHELVIPEPTEIISEERITYVQTDVDLMRDSKCVKKTLTIPEWLNKRAESKGVNFSKVLQEALVALL